MAKRGRKVTVFNEDYLSELAKKIEDYTDKTEIPILAEFAYQNGVIRQELYKHPELSFAIKRLIEKKEAQLERLGLEGKLNSTMTVFSLKQLGWKDKQEVEHSGTIENKVSNMSDEERAQRKAELLRKLNNDR